jgi:hypothetical protein
VLAARSSRLGPALLLVVVALDLAVSTWNLQSFVPRTVATAVPPAAKLIHQEQAARLEPARIYRSPAVDGVMNQRAAVNNAAQGELRLLATLIPSTVNVWGIASLPGYDAGIPASFDRVWGAGWSRPESQLATLRLLGADYAVLSGPDTLARPMAPGLEPAADLAPGARLFRVSHSLPPVFLVGRGENITDGEALSRLFLPEVVAGEVALLAPGTDALAGPPGRAGACTLTSYSTTRLFARCEAEREALAVLVEQFAAGWDATVDGQPTPVARANLVMRAVRLSPGSHEIVFDYHAPGLRPGLVVSLLSLFGILGLAVAARWRKGKEEGVPTSWRKT